MQIQIKDIKCGDVFYAINLFLERFKKLNAVRIDGKIIFSYDNNNEVFLIDSLDNDIVIFDNYKSAKEYWIENYVNKEITKTMEHVVYLQNQVTQLNNQDDLE